MKQVNQLAEITISYKAKTAELPIITSAGDAFEQLLPYFNKDTIGLQEHFVVMYLNRSNRILGICKHSSGGITGTVADVRLILATALKIAASAIILCHNHPSGNLVASEGDEKLTTKIKNAADLMEIKVLDHLIITPDNKYSSMAENGRL